MSTPLVGSKPMTNAQRQERWRQRHARKLAKKTQRRGGHTAPTPEDWAALTPTLEDWNRWFLVAPDEWQP